MAAIKARTTKDLAFNTAGSIAAVAVEAVATVKLAFDTKSVGGGEYLQFLPGYRKWAYDLVADMYSCDRRASLGDITNKLVTHDVTGPTRLDATINMQFAIRWLDIICDRAVESTERP